MKRIRFDSSSEIDVEQTTAHLLAELGGATRVPGDPFDRHIAEQIRIANTIPGTQRGKDAVVASAKGLKQRFGPGAEIAWSLAGMTGRIIVSRSWVVASFAEAPPRDALERLLRVFRSLGEGSILEVDRIGTDYEVREL